MAGEELTDRQRAFVAVYVGDARFNATKAAKLAGYSEDTAQEQGSRLLSNVMVRAEIKRFLSELAASSEESVARVSRRSRATIGNFFQRQEGMEPQFSLEHAFETGEIDNVKSIRPVFGATGRGWAVTLHDPLAADRLLIQVHGLLRAEADGEDMDDGAAIGEAIRFLEEQGYKVIPPEPEGG